MNYEQKEYASKGVAGAGLGLGIAGTALGLFANHGGFGLFGNGGYGIPNMAATAAGCAVNDKMSCLESEIARLKAEKYTDQNDAELRDSLLKNWLKPLADEAASNKVKIATLECEISKNKEISELQMKLIEQRVGGLEYRMNAITSIKVPNTAVCPGWGPVNITPVEPNVTAIVTGQGLTSSAT